MEIDHRPWGSYEVLLDAEDVKVKRISIKPGEAPSYQYHYKRKEIWTIVSGQGQLRLNDEFIDVVAGQTVFVDFQDKHQIKNTGKENLVFIETQLGTYFGEDDIVRLEDNYGRI
jgi:mannose-6-phosphate isomerase-like protein (cupin superfamily)